MPQIIDDSSLQPAEGLDSARTLRDRLIIGIAALLSIAGIVGGFGMLWRYSTTPGEAASARGQWPSQASFKLDPDRLTLVMLIHPHCACTEATLGELETLVHEMGPRVRPYVLVLRPAGMSREWAETATYRRALAVPNTRVIVDDEGRLADLFGAKTSEQTLVYTPAGRLVFNGGITLLRGHPGAGPGASLVASLTPQDQRLLKSNVFGCPLKSPKECKGSMQ